MTYVIRIVGLAGVVAYGDVPASIGQLVKSFDPDAHDGRGDLETTLNLDEALQFDSVIDAAEFWRSQSKVRPLRPDGMPNRPLAAFHVSVEPA